MRPCICRKPRQRKHPHACICYSPTIACLSRAAVSWIILAGQPKLLEACPKVAAQWHPSRNGDQALGTVTCGSGLKAWWLCKDAQCGHQHSWQATISDRVKRQSGCPVALVASHASAIPWQHSILTSSRSSGTLSATLSAQRRCCPRVVPRCTGAASFMSHLTPGRPPHMIDLAHVKEGV